MFNLKASGSSSVTGPLSASFRLHGASFTCPLALCKADEHLMSVVPGWKPMDKTELDRLLSVMGATEDNREGYLQCFNLAAQEVVGRGGVRVIGRKPQPDDPSVYTVPVPDSDHVIRMWDGGMGPYDQFCLDFYDLKRRASVNLPAGYSLHPATIPTPGLGLGSPPPPAGFPVPMSSSPFMLAGQLRSWERNQGMYSIPEGEERWSIPEGTYIMLRREGHPDFTFQMPTRQIAPFAVAQPQLGRPL